MFKAMDSRSLALLALLGCAAVADAQSKPDPVTIRAIAQVELRETEQGHEVTRLAPADRVGSGDQIIYTLEVRNTAATAIPAPAVTYAIPAHVWYMADSAVGPGTDISYSVDGGRSFDKPEKLKVPSPNGARDAQAADYTHIRWQLKHALRGNSVAFVRFRAQVK
jgi:uncharacterized repeat protein (TIGR01451 family)